MRGLEEDWGHSRRAGGSQKDLDAGTRAGPGVLRGARDTRGSQDLSEGSLQLEPDV